MIDHLGVLLDGFPGSANQTRCFLHILNITAKSIIKQFDLPKATNGEVMDEAAQALADLADGLEEEDQEEYNAQEEGEDDDPSLDRWTNIHDGLSEERRNEIDLGVQLVRLMLTKVVT